MEIIYYSTWAVLFSIKISHSNLLCSVQDQVFILTNIYFSLLDESLVSQIQASDFPLLLRLGKKRIHQMRKTHCTHYIISWKEEVGPSDGFCQKLLTLWREPVACSRSKRWQFSPFCLLRKYISIFIWNFLFPAAVTRWDITAEQRKFLTCYTDFIPPAEPRTFLGWDWWEKLGP